MATLRNMYSEETRGGADEFHRGSGLRTRAEAVSMAVKEMSLIIW